LVCSVGFFVDLEVFIGEHGDKYREREANFRAKKQGESEGRKESEETGGERRFFGREVFRAKKQEESGGSSGLRRI